MTIRTIAKRATQITLAIAVACVSIGLAMDAEGHNPYLIWGCVALIGTLGVVACVLVMEMVFDNA